MCRFHFIESLLRHTGGLFELKRNNGNFAWENDQVTYDVILPLLNGLQWLSAYGYIQITQILNILWISLSSFIPYCFPRSHLRWPHLHGDHFSTPYSLPEIIYPISAYQLQKFCPYFAAHFECLLGPEVFLVPLEDVHASSSKLPQPLGSLL